VLWPPSDEHPHATIRDADRDADGDTGRDADGGGDRGGVSAAGRQAGQRVGQEEWTFSCWAGDGSLGLITGYRLVGAYDAWYWWALARRGEPLLHVTEFAIPRRSNPLLAKAEAMWAELTCEAPFEQWTVANETYAVALDDPQEALRRAYGEATPVAMDLEWYATAEPAPLDRAIGPAPGVQREGRSATVFGYQQLGTAHGQLELGRGVVELAELPAHRTHRWSAGPLPAASLGFAVAHVGLRAPFRLGDGGVLDLVLTTDGWRTRRATASAPDAGA
jgi:hypothetical protein